MVDITKDEAYAAAELIDMYLYEAIRNDTDIDSMQWLCNIVHCFEKLCKYGEYDYGGGNND